jgi:hypothetical protein
MNFEVHGPFQVPRNGALVARRKRDQRPFWDMVEERVESLSSACGCYVFEIHGRVWYVGLAKAQSFRRECFASHKINLYNDALQSVQGKPSILFVPKRTPTGRFAKPSRRGHRDIAILENLLIGSGLRRNSKLLNVRGTKLLREMRVPGVLNSRQGQGRSVAVQCFRRVLGL